MTPAEYDRHKEWLQGQIAFTLDRLQAMWAIRDHVEISRDMRAGLIDLRERIEWWIERADRPCADAAPISTELPSSGQSTAGFAKPTPSSPGRDSRMGAGKNRSPAAVT